MSGKAYWQECVESSLGEHGISATAAQIIAIADDVQGAHENYGLAFYQPGNPLISEVAELKRELKNERAKVFCEECHGKGRIISQYGTLTSDSECGRCHGEGKHKP